MQNKGCWRTKIENKIKIRRAKPRDIEAVFQIEEEQFSNPWKKHHFFAELSHDIAFVYVAEDLESREIVGYTIFWIVEETMEIHDIAVTGGHQKRGIGSKLMDFILGTAGQKGVKEIFLEVRESNLKARRFYEKHNFKKIDVRKNYFINPKEDALIYALYL